MGVLLVAPPAELGTALVRRLVSQRDDARVVEPDEGNAAAWKALGAHVASGRPDDADLIERAAQGARTIVLFTQHAAAEAIRGARFAGVDRVVVYVRRAGGRLVDDVASSGLDFVVLSGGRHRFRTVAPDAAAAAIDAADDLAGNPRLQLDLGDPAAWTALRLEPPA